MSPLGIETWVLKTQGPGKPGHFAKPKTRVCAVCKTRGFRVCIFAPRVLRLMKYYTILDNSKHVVD